MFVHSPAVLATRLAPGEIVVMNADHATYFGLTDTAAAIWEQFERPARLDTVVSELCARFAIEPEQCRIEATDFVEQLVAAALLVPVD